MAGDYLLIREYPERSFNGCQTHVIPLHKGSLRGQFVTGSKFFSYAAF
jgi:hypothetical protein